MYLYRFEVTIHNDIIDVVIAAENDDKAFELVDVELELHYLKMPEIDEITLFEKKRIRGGAGYVYDRGSHIN